VKTCANWFKVPKRFYRAAIDSVLHQIDAEISLLFHDTPSGSSLDPSEQSRRRGVRLNELKARREVVLSASVSTKLPD
jgi:hypothetical protein